jgi:lipase
VKAEFAITKQPSSFSVPIVLVHGLIGSLRADDLHAALAPARTLAPDLLGYGTNGNVDPSGITIADEATHLHRQIQAIYGAEPIHLVGFSAGGVVSLALARRYPLMIAGLVLVESNFTLKDAAWSATLAAMSQAEADAVLDGFRSRPETWLARFGVPPTAEYLAKANDWIWCQTGQTVRAMAQALVEMTGKPSYLPMAAEVFDQVPVHLLAGERSLPSWDLPDWTKAKAQSFTVLPCLGHIMMLEDSAAFASAIHSITANREEETA